MSTWYPPQQPPQYPPQEPPPQQGGGPGPGDEWWPEGEPQDAPLTYDTTFTSATPEVSALDRYLPSTGDLGLVRPERPTGRHGWRRALDRATGGSVAPGAGRARHAQAPTQRGICSIAVLSLKGGVGKTTTTVGLGATMAAVRGDRVIAVDANPDFGTLAQRGPDEVRSTVRDLLSDNNVGRYSDVRRHTSQSASRLEFLGSERDPAASEAFSESDYLRVHQILDRYYNVVLADCGTGLTHSAIQGVLDTANALVVVASPAIDSARSALATLDWLEHHGFDHLVPSATLVVNSCWAGDTPVDTVKLRQFFQSRIQRVFVIPYDEHLAEGGEINLESMNRKTRQAYRDLANSMPECFRSGREFPIY